MAGASQDQPATLPTSSRPSGDKDVKGKLHINVQADGSVVGINCHKWSSRAGDLVRTHIPIYYKDWRDAPRHFKDDVWNALMGEFTLNVSPIVARPSLEKAWPQKFRTYKKSLRDYLRINGPSAAGPKGVDPNHWKKFIESESDPKKQLQNTKNAENRGKLRITHCLGRCTYAQKMFTQQEKEPEKKFRRVDNWCLGHERKDGSVLESAKEAYDQLKALGKRNNSTSLNGEGDSYAYGDIASDELTEVLGKDPNGRVRAIGSHVSKKQLIQLGIAMEKAEQLKKANEEEAAMKNELFSRLSNCEDILKVLLHQKNKESASQVVTAPTSDLRINSNHIPPNLAQNVENVFAGVDASQQSHSMDKPQVIVCDKFGKDLAKGYVVTDGTAGTCHFKKVARGEKKVYIGEVYDPDAHLWAAPQGGHDTLAGYVQGGFLIWLDCWLKYL